jgi:hypothetical protein
MRKFWVKRFTATAPAVSDKNANSSKYSETCSLGLVLLDQSHQHGLLFVLYCFLFLDQCESVLGKDNLSSIVREDRFVNQW